MSTDNAGITRRALEDALMDGLTRYLNGEAKRRDLPPLTWSPDTVIGGGVEAVRGYAGRADFEDPAKVVAAWADAFGAEVQVKPHRTHPYLETVFVLDGVKVLVWCPIGEWD